MPPNHVRPFLSIKASSTDKLQEIDAEETVNYNDAKIFDFPLHLRLFLRRKRSARLVLPMQQNKQQQ